MGEQSRLILTADGCHTVYSALFDATYHSIHGAIQESKMVYVELGFQHMVRQDMQCINIFEMGFGTGLNALMTLISAEQFKINTSYVGLEAHPLEMKMITQLNYNKILKIPKCQEILIKMHNCKANQKLNLSEYFDFEKQIMDIANYDSEKKFDIIYYDAFAPSCQPNLWEAKAMEKMYKMLNDGGILVTYCSKGSFKRTLKSVGFTVEAAPGPGRKREITRATKSFQ